MRSLFLAVLVSTAMGAVSSPGRAAAPKIAHPAKPAAKAPAQEQETPKQRAALAAVVKQVEGLDAVVHAPLTKDYYQAKVDAAYHLLIIPLSDLSPKSEPATHARNAFQAYRDALTAWDEPVPYSEWDNIQDGPYMTPGIVKKYHIRENFLQDHQDLDVYDLEDYAHKFINDAIWKYARDEYLKTFPLKY